MMEEQAREPWVFNFQFFYSFSFFKLVTDDLGRVIRFGVMIDREHKVQHEHVRRG